MTDPIRFTLDGAEVEAAPGETIWQVAQRHGVEIPHLCWLPKPGYRADGNCRACMVEIEGERVLAASCIRRPTPGMKVQVASERAKASRQLVFELLIGDQPDRAAAHDPESRLWQWADALDIADSRFPRRAPAAPDRSHPAMAVQLDACIHCNLCVRACREVQGKDGPANHNRLCVKGRFGFDYVHHPDRLTEPLIRKDGVGKEDVAIDPANPFTHFRKASWAEALDRAAEGLKRIRDRDGRY